MTILTLTPHALIGLSCVCLVKRESWGFSLLFRLYVDADGVVLFSPTQTAFIMLPRYYSVRICNTSIACDQFCIETQVFLPLGDWRRPTDQMKGIIRPSKCTYASEVFQFHLGLQTWNSMSSLQMPCLNACNLVCAVGRPCERLDTHCHFSKSRC